MPPNQDRSFSGTSSNLRIRDSYKVVDDSQELIADEPFDKCRIDIVMNLPVLSSPSCNYTEREHHRPSQVPQSL
ncbi:hypothetical protein OIU84_021107 [Salix udensis]|uniref:Uncharacterized protein n=1 Tax=Salix udensis TaxID=889485 RepID=A0AAD6KWF5_9ROSI|nr:hypothetical protein OIU84_021107 [Salix udensis]